MGNRKKILFIMPYLQGGGAEKVLIDILRRIDRSAFKLTILLIYKEGIYVDKIPTDIEVLSLYSCNSLNRQRLLRHLQMFGLYHKYVDFVYAPKIRWLLKGRKFDTIVSFMEGAAVRLHSYIFTKASRNVSWVHIDLLTKHWSKDYFRDDAHEKAIYERMDGIAFVSCESRDKFKELFNYDRNNLKVIYNLIPKEEIIALSEREKVKYDKFTIVLVGRLNDQKCFSRAIEVANLLRKDNLEFNMTIIGEGEERESLQELIDNYNLRGYVNMPGFKHPPYPYMKEADIYLSVSKSEGYPLTLCEAMCLGLPVISTRTSGSVEIIEESEYGVLVDHEVDAIYAKVKEMMMSAPMRVFYSARSSERSTCFDEKNTLKQIGNFLCQENC